MSTLVLVHAHPDDESISTGGAMLRAKRAGHRVVLVTATRGEEGEIHNMEEAATRPRLAEVRTDELRRAGEILGVDRQVFLGYRDSGMAGTEANHHPGSFHLADLEQAADRLETTLREERPEVVVTYTPDGTYGHPDHIKAHQVTVAALDRLDREGWRPAKFYLTAIPRRVMEQLAQRWQEAGREPSSLPRMGIPDEEITTIVDVREFAERKQAAFAAHVSQNNPNSPFGRPAGQIFDLVFGTEHYVLARGSLSEARPEPDLFAEI